MANPKGTEPRQPDPGNPGIRPISNAGLDAFLASVPNEVDRNNAIVALGHFLQGQPDGYSAHLIAAMIAHAHAMRATAERVEKAQQEHKDIPAVVRRIDDNVGIVERSAHKIANLSTFFNLAWPAMVVVLTAALCIGGMVLWHDHAEKAEQAKRDHTLEAQLLRNLDGIGAKLSFDLTDNGQQMTVKVSPGSWKLKSPVADLDGNAEVVLAYPASTPASSPSLAHHP